MIEIDIGLNLLQVKSNQNNKPDLYLNISMVPAMEVNIARSVP